jgi:hypothetical protein
MTSRGRMHWFVKGTPIFHGCVPVDEQGDNLSMVVGRNRRSSAKIASRPLNAI